MSSGSTTHGKDEDTLCTFMLQMTGLTHSHRARRIQRFERGDSINSKWCQHSFSVF